MNFASQVYSGPQSPDLFWLMEPGVDMSDQTEADWRRVFPCIRLRRYDNGVPADIVSTMELARFASGATGKVGLNGLLPWRPGLTFITRPAQSRFLCGLLRWRLENIWSREPP